MVGRRTLSIWLQRSFRELSGYVALIRPIWLDFIETILVYKLPRLSREEIKTMFALNEIELKQTRFYQEAVEEGCQEECIALVTR